MKTLRVSTLLARSLRFHWRVHLGVFLGATLATAILVGALAVGDSVRYSLERQALLRLGNIEFVIQSSNRFFRARLADDGLGFATGGVTVAPALILRGSVTTPDGSVRVPRVQILGVDSRFENLEPWPSRERREKDKGMSLADGQTYLNPSLFNLLNVSTGQTLVVRVEKYSALPLDAPFASDQNRFITMRVEVRGITPDAFPGRFDLQANPVPPPTLFVPLEWLQNQLGLQGRANTLLVDRTETGRDFVTEHELNEQLQSRWQLADADFELREIANANVFELRTQRAFIESHITEAIEKAAPPTEKILTYFVNELRAGERSTPYSFVASASPGDIIPDGMNDDEMILNSWLANDLQATTGDTVTIKYLVFGAGRKLEEQSASFRVRNIIPLQPAHREWMPQFAGLSDAENCRDWDAGIPIDFTKIRPKDEDYWRDHRGSPKAFLSLAEGQKLWGNRFGNLTAMRWNVEDASRLFPHGADNEVPRRRLYSALEDKIRSALDPAWFGLFAQPVREQARKAARESQDFGHLFLGFSFFLIAAALLLMGLLFAFGVEQRSDEVGVLLVLGWKPRAIRRLFWLEGFVLALAGGALGTLGGMGYAKATLWVLTTHWRTAISGAELWFHAEPTTLLIGCGASLLLATGTIGMVLRRQARRTARELLSKETVALDDCGSPRPATASTTSLTWNTWTALFGGLLAGVFVVRGILAELSPASFFAAGSFLLMATLAICAGLLRGAQTRNRAPCLLWPPRAAAIALGNAARRRGRSMATVAMLACGIFLVIAVGANRQDPMKNAHKRSSGTGGFALWVETSIPVVHDLNTREGREAVGLLDPGFEKARVLSLRVRDGDDASCLNLNRAQQPKLFGVATQELEGRFSTIKGGLAALLRSAETETETPLRRSVATPEIPTVGDEATVRWALGKKVGDTIPYRDESGRTVQLKIVGMIANSVFQGGLILSEENFTGLFPSESGYRAMLVDAQYPSVAELSKELSRALRDYGAEIQPAAERLAQFAAVENTYLAIFSALGGLGLLLGSAGLGIVVARNVMERRAELAILRAVGFPHRQVRRLVMAEHAWLLLLGLACGMISALVAVAPALCSRGTSFAYATVPVWVGAVLVSGAAWIELASIAALQGNLIRSLRNE